MTPKQNTLYWREWAAVHRADSASDRHTLHIKALGRDKSSKLFNNADLDRVLGVFRAISRPADLDGQLRQIQMPRTRLLYSISRLADAAYIAKISTDKFGQCDLDRLTDAQLDQLRITLMNRKRAMNRKLAEKKVKEPF